MDLFFIFGPRYGIENGVIFENIVKALIVLMLKNYRCIRWYFKQRPELSS